MKIPDYVFTCLKDNGLTLIEKREVDKLMIDEFEELIDIDLDTAEYDEIQSLVGQKCRERGIDTKSIVYDYGFVKSYPVIRIEQKYHFESLDEYYKTKDDFEIQWGHSDYEFTEMDDEYDPTIDAMCFGWNNWVESKDIKSYEVLDEFLKYCFQYEEEGIDEDK